MINRRFQQCVLRAPNAIALSCATLQLTYSELDRHANRIAGVLVKAGVRPREFVPICMNRSVDAVVAMLGIVRVGAAFVPIDPSFPTALKRHYVEQCSARCIVVSDSANVDLQDKAGGLTLVSMMAVAATQIGEAVDTIHAPCDAETPAYVMFTSGSTGSPKGVIVPHRGVIRLVCDTNYISINENDVLMLLSPITFDASTFEIWGALLNGARLAVWEESIFDPNRLRQRLRAENVSVLWLTAALFHLLARRNIDIFSGLRVILAGGDVVQATAVNAVLDAFPDIAVINGYGPTENTTFTCCHTMTRDNRPRGSVPIGRAINGTDVHVLDSNLLPVPDNEIGELCTSGLGVAKGYLNAPEATRLAFIEWPPVAGSLYRTGDLVVRRSDGVLEFIGRDDQIVKVRGFRISVDEVRASIARIPNVEASFVEVRRDDNGDNYLDAIVQMPSRGAGTASYIRCELRKAVPDFMIPGRITIVSDLPLNAHGKIDRKQLRRAVASSGEHHA